MTMHRLTIGSLQLNVSVRGRGSPLLLINGLGGLIRAFDPLRDELADYQTITWDVLGVGESQLPRWPMRMSRHADIIAEILGQLGIDQIDVCGVSWGGALAQEFALRHPSRVRRLILAATSAGPVMFVKPVDILEFFASKRRTSPSTLKASPHPIHRLLRFGVVNGMLTTNPRTYYHQLTALVGWSSLLRLFQLRQRTMILAGELDPLVRRYNANIQKRTIRHAELHVLPGEGHFFVVTNAIGTARAIRDFLC